ncbi:MAG TPA: hypothetical protein VE988_03825 [Gemmataceae bacterium]|nr:hypothetical protein [Gemmataceae bacterium]
MYGGLEFDYLALKSTWSASNMDGPKPTQFVESLGKSVLLTTMIAIDVPLSFAGDTITLPQVFLVSGIHGWGEDAVKIPPTVRPTEVLPVNGNSAREIENGFEPSAAGHRPESSGQ